MWCWHRLLTYFLPSVELELSVVTRSGRVKRRAQRSVEPSFRLRCPRWLRRKICDPQCVVVIPIFPVLELSLLFFAYGSEVSYSGFTSRAVWQPNGDRRLSVVLASFLPRDGHDFSMEWGRHIVSAVPET